MRERFVARRSPAGRSSPTTSNFLTPANRVPITASGSSTVVPSLAKSHPLVEARNLLRAEETDLSQARVGYSFGRLAVMASERGVSRLVPGTLPPPRTGEPAAATNAAEFASKLSTRIEHRLGAGSKLEPRVRDFFEPHLGHDFAHVRIHADAEADRLTRELGADAFTTEANIFFRHGHYRPDKPEGRQLLAHELTHTIQQIGSTASGSSHKHGLSVGEAGDAFEREASWVAARIVEPVEGVPAQRGIDQGAVTNTPAFALARPRASLGALAPIGKSAGVRVIQRQQASGGTVPASQPDTTRALTPTRIKELETLIAGGYFQEAVSRLVGYKHFDKEINLDLLANRTMTYDPGITSDDAVTSPGSWDYLQNKAEPSRVRIGKTAFESVPYLYSVIMHEYQHVLWQQTHAHQQESELLRQQNFTRPDEIRAGAWELLHADATGIARFPERVGQIWKNLNDFFWKLDAKAQAEERPLVTKAFEKAKALVKGTSVALVAFRAP